MKVITPGASSEHITIALPPTFSTEGSGQADVNIAVAGFEGRLFPWVECQDFACFALQLRALYETLRGSAEFAPVERQPIFSLMAAVGGHVELAGVAPFGPLDLAPAFPDTAYTQCSAG